MNNLIKKNFFSEDGLFSLTVILENEEILFDAEKVAECLGFTKTEIKNGKEYTSIRWERVNEYLKKFRPQVGEIRKGDYIPEPAVYKLAFKASNDIAENFQDWLAIEVIPEIRKYGSYSIKRKESQDIIAAQQIISTMKAELTDIVDSIVEKKVAELEDKCSEYIRPLSKRKQNICQYIKRRLEIDKVNKEYELVKDRVLLILGGDKWEDIPVEVLKDSMDLIDESIKIIKSDRTVNQLSLF